MVLIWHTHGVAQHTLSIVKQRPELWAARPRDFCSATLHALMLAECDLTLTQFNSTLPGAVCPLGHGVMHRGIGCCICHVSGGKLAGREVAVPSQGGGDQVKAIIVRQSIDQEFNCLACRCTCVSDDLRAEVSMSRPNRQQTNNDAQTNSVVCRALNPMSCYTT